MILTDLQKNKLIQFNKDETMRDVVFKILYSFVDLNEFSDQTEKYSNAQLGQIMRGNISGAKLLKLGLKEILKYKGEEEKGENKLTQIGL